MSTARHETTARRRPSRALRLIALAGALTLCGSATAQAAPLAARAGSPGAPGIGDVYYPDYGNGGYDVQHYRIDLDYEPTTDQLAGTTTIRARATQDLSRFNLDFVLPVSSVTVNGTRARFDRSDPHELVITPRRVVRDGATMRVKVSYAGVPSQTEVDGLDPWVRTADGAVAVGEPEIAAWWYPSNDHPRDKATYAVNVTVPAGVEVLGNGTPKATQHHGDRDTWRWRERHPMAPYLAFIAIGQFDVTQGRTADGTPWVNAVASNGGSEGEYAQADLARTPEIIAWHTSKWGPYPFEAIGGVAPKADFGFALENQTRPVYTRGFWRGGSNIYVVVHENAHQWYGDSVSVDQWKDIWLNEGFASFAEWLWSEDHGEGSAQDLLMAYYDYYPADSSFWKLRIGDPGKGREFSGAVYDRGAMTLQALRNRVGDDDFFRIMRTWAQRHRYSNGYVMQFIVLAEKVSGQNLGSFFDAWLYQPTKPAMTPENGFPSSATASPARRFLPPESKAKIDAVRDALVADPLRGPDPAG